MDYSRASASKALVRMQQRNRRLSLAKHGRRIDGERARHSGHAEETGGLETCLVLPWLGHDHLHRIKDSRLWRPYIPWPSPFGNGSVPTARGTPTHLGRHRAIAICWSHAGMHHLSQVEWL